MYNSRNYIHKTTTSYLGEEEHTIEDEERTTWLPFQLYL